MAHKYISGRRSLVFNISTAFALALLLSACAGPRDRRPDDSRFVQSVAVLPLYNATNDVDGPQLVREQAVERLRKARYRNLPLADVDVILRDRMGITLGAQLDLATPEAIGAELGVDYLLYGYLLDFNTVTTGVYNVNKVRAAFKLVDAKTGVVVWSRAAGVKNEIHSAGDLGRGLSALSQKSDRSDDDIYTTIPGLANIPGLSDWVTKRSRHEKSVGNAALFSLGEQLVTQALGVHLYLETSEALDRIMAELPHGR
ncbi:MAG: hypothetical protein A3J24_00120 [Deltaproteobacteria bacterium RIFCSPLOWO2_02_FULL_53_8]|nr:MAG: hypothetical protein A3J24_00120 [Deltaproteobacteria bacterium RIFCSPLOWO2_02_FULL_53_8]